MEGSLRTIPSPRTNTSVFAVPRSIARSSENCSAHRLKNITLPDSFQIYHVPRGGSSPAAPPALASAAPAALAVDDPKAARKLAPEPVTELRRGRHRVRVAVAHEPLPGIPLEVPEPVNQLALNRLDAWQTHRIERARER